MIEVKPEFDEKKATEAAILLLHMAGQPKKHKWLIKMLYLIERESFDRYERPILYDNLCSMKNGQVVSTTYNLIKGETGVFGDVWKKHIQKDFRWMLHTKPEELENLELSVAEREIIENVFNDFGHMHEDELGEYTHELPEYSDPGNSSLPTSYAKLLTALGYDQSDIDRILEELKQEALLDTVLGG